MFIKTFLHKNMLMFGLILLCMYYISLPEVTTLKIISVFIYLHVLRRQIFTIKLVPNLRDSVA